MSHVAHSNASLGSYKCVTAHTRMRHAVHINVVMSHIIQGIIISNLFRISLSRTHTHAHKHTNTHTHTHSLSLSPSNTYTHSRTHTHTRIIQGIILDNLFRVSVVLRGSAAALSGAIAQYDRQILQKVSSLLNY